MTVFRDRAAEDARRLKGWLFDSALPLWADKGVDRINGGFHELLALDGSTPPVPRRARVQPRQIYVFALAGRMGWRGPWADIIRHGLDYYRRFYLKADGTMRALVAPDGSPLDDSFDLYNQAFGLLALTTAAASLKDRRLMTEAEALRDHLVSRFVHPLGGFHRSVPHGEPLESNPQMHLFEAMLAAEIAARDIGSDASEWTRLADNIGELCLARLIDQKTGVLREFFDLNWRPAPGLKGRIVEPGHQLEWAWLLIRWGERRNRPDAFAAARRLIELAETLGFDPVRRVQIMQLLDDFSVHDPVARLWPQTEWIKAAIALATIATTDAEREAAYARAVTATVALDRFLDVPLAGTYRDKLLADDRFVDEPAPASSLYHIACAIDEFERAMRGWSVG
jgi:mannose/cellobiose epimerase-like protein (N-acyl-D-glucosamine 2-epimerase family)